MPRRNTLITVLMQTEIDLDTGCWNFLGAKNWKGYGRISFSGKTRSVHRLVYKLLNPNMPEELHCLHRCDNPPCCNPDHLFLGTNQDNVTDMISKGRKVLTTKIPEEQKQEIINLRMKQIPRKVIAEKFGIHPDTVGHFTRGVDIPPQTNEDRHKPVRIYNNDFEQVFVSRKAAASYLQVNPSVITRAVTNGYKCKGFSVEYI